MNQLQSGQAPEAAELLLCVAEQLKLPLTTLAREIELGKLRGGEVDLSSLQVHTRVALRLVDSYMLGLQLAAQQSTLALEPVSVSSTLTDTAQELYEFARQYNVELEVRIAGRYGPVMAHATGLKAALLSLGYGLIEAQAARSGSGKRLVLAAHRNTQGIVAGLYGQQDEFGVAQWRRALELCGRARQPLPALSTGSGAGLFVADAIMHAMATRLRVSRHLKQTGLATTLLPSQQLRLV